LFASRGFGTQYWWVWVAVGFNIGSIVINVLAFITAATFLPGDSAATLANSLLLLPLLLALAALWV
jgi:hypothetical protein